MDKKLPLTAVLQKRGDVQTWRFVLRIKFSAGRQFCALYSPPSPSPEPLAVIRRTPKLKWVW